MNLFTGVESAELFGGDVPPSVAHLITVARNAPPDQVAAALWTAALSSPHSLAVHYLLYKFHAGRGELEQARHAAETGLRMAAQAAGLPTDWRAVAPGQADFDSPGAARFWLFTLKALAFIHLRRADHAAAASLAAQLRRLDPADRLGRSVIEAMLQVVEPQRGAPFD